jgi:para-nitrobenzyl esterase
MFKGIPFAQPPIGDLRWKEPQPVKNWEGTWKADHFSARAMQLPIYSDMKFRSAGISEDCLYLIYGHLPKRDRKIFRCSSFFTVAE